MKKAKLIAPYGGKLVDLVLTGEEREKELARAYRNCPPSRSPCATCATWSFSPPADSRLSTPLWVRRIMSVCCMRCAWQRGSSPLPITLTADPKELPTVGEDIVLRNTNNDVIAIMTLDEVYHWDAETEAALAYGSTDAKHPMISEMARWNKVCITGPLKVVNLPKYYDFRGAAPHACPGALTCWRIWATTMWSPSRPATHCTASTKN